MGKVFELDLGRDEFPVMIALADHASDDGTSIYPSIDYLAWKTNMSQRSVQRILRKLEDRGIVEVVGNAAGGRGQRREYVIHIENGDKKTPFREWIEDVRTQRRGKRKGDKLSPNKASKARQNGTLNEEKRVTLVTQKGDTGDAHYLIEPSENRQLAARPRTKPRKRDLLFEAIAEAWLGKPYPEIRLTKTQRGKINAAASELREVGADYRKVPSEWARIRRMFDNPGPMALAANWGANGTGPKPASRASPQGALSDEEWLDALYPEFGSEITDGDD